MIITDEKVDEIQDYLERADSIAWDTCHKIYILLDKEQTDLMRKYEYDPLITSKDMSPQEMEDMIQRWYEDSCGLKFISAVSTGDEGEPVFYDVIPQFYGEEEDPEDE